jgi:hypothetical protein
MNAPFWSAFALLKDNKTETNGGGRIAPTETVRYLDISQGIFT